MKINNYNYFWKEEEWICSIQDEVCRPTMLDWFFVQCSMFFNVQSPDWLKRLGWSDNITKQYKND